MLSLILLFSIRVSIAVNPLYEFSYMSEGTVVIMVYWILINWAS
uniref:Uncharacterized protein n=1 Tax=Setaria viridis TaxID=4556 RepID=A0A4U6TI25_SETVI|nr:hypothetical protein SEVIR_8G119380v2 [Setaria viridis]